MTGPQQDRRRPSIAARVMRPVARVTSAFMEPVYFWLGLFDAEGNPDNSKVMYTLAVIVSLYTVVQMGIRITGEKGTGISLEYTILVGMVLLFAGSLEAFKKFMRMRFGNGTNGNGSTPPATGSGATS